MSANSPQLTPEALAKRETRARKRAAQQAPEARQAALEVAMREADRKQERRQLRDVEEAAALCAWALRGGTEGELCELVDIGANLVKTEAKDTEAVDRQLVRCSRTGVRTVIVTGTSVAASERGLQCVRRVHDASRSPGADGAVALHCTAGVHPHVARHANETTVDALRSLLAAPECVAVGECGLDYDRMFSPRRVQLDVFARQAALAAQLDMPMFIHERDRAEDKGGPLGSSDDLIEVLDAAGVRPELICVHCFTGSEEALRRYAARGYHVGLTGFVGMRERGRHVREALRGGALPLSQLMLETDAPFMKPDRERLPNVKSLRQGQCEPCVLPAVARAVAECFGVDPAEVAKVTTANARGFFRLPTPSD